MHNRLNTANTATIVTLFAIAYLGQAAAAADAPIVAREAWTNVTAGEELTLHFRMPDAAAGQTVGWSVAVENAVIARSQSEVRSENRAPVLTVKFRVPEGEPKTVTPVLIRVARNGHEIPVKRLWIFPSDPFQRAIPNLPSEPLVLFDPQRKTAACLEQTPLRFRLEKNLDALAELQTGVIVIGEGVSFREFRGLPGVIRRAAQREIKVLCLSPSAGALDLDSDESVQELTNLNLARSDVLATFEKHLDSRDWRGTSPVRPNLPQLVGRSRQISAEVKDDALGWPWIEAEYSGGGRIIVCCLRVIEHWESGPAPRHALWNILAHSVRPASTDPQSPPPD